MNRYFKQHSFGVLVALVFCCGFSRAASGGQPKGESSPNPVWPALPEEPRIAYVQQLTQPADAGVKPAFFRRLGNWITGDRKNNELFVKPFALALDENNNLCLTDTAASAVGYLNFTKKKWSYWKRIGNLRFVSPVAVAKKNGIFFVADSALGIVVAFNESGKLTFQIKGDLQRPAGVAIAGNRLFVADSQRHCVDVFDLGGKPIASFGKRGAGPGEFNFPTHLAADGEGHLLVTDSLNNRVQLLDLDGHHLHDIGSLGDTPGHFSRPKGAAADSFGHIYVIDALFDNIQIFDAESRLLLSLGQAGAEKGQFWMPNGIAINADNRIFVADSYNHRVQIFQYLKQP